MNRQIKFRVWNGYEMVEDVTVGKLEAFWTSGISESDNQSLGNTTKYDNYLSVMQFTGLHDMNGKEIYHGDIVKWGMHKGSEEYFHRYAVVEFNPDIQFRILFYVNSETGEKKPTDNYIFHFGKFAYKETDKHIEIIGNVFENPDLVKL